MTIDEETCGALHPSGMCFPRHFPGRGRDPSGCGPPQTLGVVSSVNLIFIGASRPLYIMQPQIKSLHARYRTGGADILQSVYPMATGCGRFRLPNESCILRLRIYHDAQSQVDCTTKPGQERQASPNSLLLVVELTFIMPFPVSITFLHYSKRPNPWTHAINLSFLNKSNIHSHITSPSFTYSIPTQYLLNTRSWQDLPDSAKQYSTCNELTNASANNFIFLKTSFLPPAFHHTHSDPLLCLLPLSV
ncbi:uncharacterized protein BDR25DRAFT_354354 [Lindgomyces ingoldianus]|uniref:Uncharacterized protein n=1 Tax=Lindgomyces ingoldianus TaxID=673940 RepID=A0ACB6R0I2_9PLEO|nr:uncharacterized protein BDR25DRAFT_354354 [Lindgomyces ingoldianus]KAF2471847.1 hypothetical protein BDR25DRAFT_354354 [Lindgomyces ingoldianus]